MSKPIAAGKRTLKNDKQAWFLHFQKYSQKPLDTSKNRGFIPAKITASACHPSKLYLTFILIYSYCMPLRSTNDNKRATKPLSSKIRQEIVYGLQFVFGSDKLQLSCDIQKPGRNWSVNW